jgi:hypothetical protein
MADFPEVADLELEKLRQEITTLKEQLVKAEEILKKNNLIEKVSAVSDAEQIALDQISRLKRISDSGLTFDIETMKIFEIVVKTLMLARGKAPPPEEKKKKEPQNTDIGKLLKIAEGKE